MATNLTILLVLVTIVAGVRNHRQRLAINVLNVVAGWTLIGWVVAFVWACTADVLPKGPASKGRRIASWTVATIVVTIVFWPVLGPVLGISFGPPAARSHQTTYCNASGSCYSK